MNLLLFGSGRRQLFGAYHPASPNAPARGGAVLCPPWGPEYLVSHRIFRRLADRLSESGFDVLRFDYYGTGDSAGDRDEGDLTSWCADASAAVDELRDMSGCTTIVAFGIRIGAVVGWRLAQMRSDVRTAVLWDPVIDGVGYTTDLIEAQAERARWSLWPKRTSVAADGALDLLGFPLTPAMRQAIEAIRPDEFSAPTSARLKLFYSDAHPGHDRLHATLRAAGTPFDVETLPGQTPWREDETIGTGGLSMLVLDRMVTVL